jgi:hypothetical protein
MATEEEKLKFPDLQERGFQISAELSQLRRDNRLVLERISHLFDLMTDVKIQVAVKLDKDEFYQRLDQVRNRGEERSRALTEVLRILGTSLAAALSAITGAKLMN